MLIQGTHAVTHMEDEVDMVRRLSDAIVTSTPRRPTRVIQFGEGNFLRAFADWQVQQMNDADVFDGGVAIVQPLATGRVAELDKQDRLYTVLLEGSQASTHEIITVINQTVNPYDDWPGFLHLADDALTCVIISNTTEAGIAVDPSDTAETVPPHGFPAKLAHLLRCRFQAGLPGFLILPCELIDDNGPALRRAVLECVTRFGWGDDLAHWIASENRFCSTLVDRIVPGFPADRAESLWASWGYQDSLIVKAETYGLWAIEGTAADLACFPAHRAGLDVVLTDDLRPYCDRKVRLLNGPHTIMAQLGRLVGLHTVREAITDPDIRDFVVAQMLDEVVPVLDLPRDEAESFAREVIERFENPSIVHDLDAIALNSVAKFVSRLLPTIKANVAAGRGLPPRTCLALAGLLTIYLRPDGVVEPIDLPAVIAAFTAADGDARMVMANASLWGEDLTAIPGLAELILDDLALIESDGVRPLLRRFK